MLQSCLTVLVGTGGMFLFASCSCACFELRSQIIVSVGFFAADPHYVKKHPVRAKAKSTYLARPGSEMALLDGTNGEQCLGQWMPNDSIGVRTTHIRSRPQNREIGKRVFSNARSAWSQPQR